MLTKCYRFVDSNTEQELSLVHAGAKLLRRTSRNGGVTGASISVEKPQQLGDSFAISSCSCKLGCEDVVTCNFSANQRNDEVAFGCPWDPLVFMKEVCSAGHPQSFVSAIPKEVEMAISNVASCQPQDIVISRCRWLGKYVSLAKELEAENQALLDRMPRHMRSVMSCKRLALLQRIIDDEKYEDTKLAEDMASGFSLVGQAPSSGGRLPEKFMPANLHVDELEDGSSRARAAVRLATSSSGDADMDSKLWLKTLEERDRGWLIGPLSWDELEENAVVSKRFPLQQGAKLRPIDDFSMSMVNATVSMRDQATTDGVDVIAATMCFFMRALVNQGRSAQLLARSFDLSAAYSCVWLHPHTPLPTSVFTTQSLVERVCFNKCVCLSVLERR